MGFRWSTTRRFLRRLRTRGAHGRLANSLLWKLAGGHGTRPTSALRESWGASDGWISWRKKKRQPTKVGVGCVICAFCHVLPLVLASHLKVMVRASVSTLKRARSRSSFPPWMSGGSRKQLHLSARVLDCCSTQALVLLYYGAIMP